MAEMTGTQIYARLMNLCDQTGEKHHERVALADKLLKDKDWVRSPEGGGGDENKAIDRLETQCFGDLCGAVSLPQLLELYHNVPDVAVWRKHRFNLKKIWADWKAKQPARKTREVPHRATREFTPAVEFAELPPARQRAEYARALKAVETDADKIVRLEKENGLLRDENKYLKTEIARLKDGVRNVFRIAQ